MGDYPELVIVSRDLARGTRKTGHAFKDAEVLPDMLVLDEAHALRKRRSATESRPSLIGRLVEELLRKVPHALFLTATPLQVDALELYDALELLGMPESFDEASFLRSLELLSIPSRARPELDQAASTLDLVASMLASYHLNQGYISPEASRLIAHDAAESNRVRSVMAAQGSWAILRDALVRVHPATTLCIRNTRETLSRVGYKFPARKFEGIECVPSTTVRIVLTKLDEYLNSNLGLVESAVYPDRATAVGFVRSIYLQRAASSLAAIQTSLNRRLERLRELQEGRSAPDDFVEEDTLDESRSFPASPREGVDYVAIRRACAIESADIQALLSMLGQLGPNIFEVDPKIRQALNQLSQFQSEGRSVLLFSRYTDTIQALISQFAALSGVDLSYASYTGDGGLVCVSGIEKRGDKGLVTRALAEGEVGIVFCSDAASEGLNLQTANAIINVDVPWNPARLEQRIGRIARLGQTAEAVDIINLWYPHSVEAKIYERVLLRKEIMELALGAFPEIVGNAIRSAVSNQSRGNLDHDVIEELNEKRNAVELEALTSLWSSLAMDPSSVGTAALRRELADVLEAISTKAKSAPGYSGPLKWVTPREDPLTGPMFTLHHEWVRWLGSVSVSSPILSSSGELGVLRRGSTALVLALREGEWLRALAPSALPGVLRLVYLGESPDLHEHVFLEVREGEGLMSNALSVTPWWPEPGAMYIPVANPDVVPTIPDWARNDLPLTFDPLFD